MVDRSEPRILIFDIESLPDLTAVMSELPGMSAYPGLTLKASINSVICFGYKWVGESQAHCLNAWDYKSWRKDVNDDSELLIDIKRIMESADCIVGHNSKRFDFKFIQTRLLKHNIAPLPKVMHVDTCAEAKRCLLMFSNRLNTLSKFLTQSEKLENGGWPLWEKVLKRDPKSMKLMTRYCKQDVEVTHKLFSKLRPLINGIPNYNMFRSTEEHVCVNCGSTRLKKDGIRVTRNKVHQKIKCTDCGTNMSLAKEGAEPRGL